MSDKVYYSLNDFQIDLDHLEKILREKWKGWEYVYGVPQGGTVLATKLSQLPALKHIDSLEGLDPKKVLIADDIIDSGTTRSKYPEYDFVSLHIAQVPHSFKSIKQWTYSVNPTAGKWIVYWWEGSEERSIEDVVIRQLQYIGENPDREGLQETPSRVIRSWKEIFSGYGQDPKEIIKTFDAEKYDELVLLKDIEMYSMCEHHMLPFFGKAHVAYIPQDKKKIIGASKLARLVEIYSRQLQTQERIAKQVTAALMQHLKPLGAACIIEAQHLCMRMRGVGKQNSTMVTSSLEGVFREKIETRNELMGLIR